MQSCILAGRWTTKRLSVWDRPMRVGGFWHVCWGPIDPAHVGKHQAQGAYDLGVCVPMCRAAHDFYDHHNSEWELVTDISEKRLENEAAGYALKYVERGGVLA